MTVTNTSLTQKQIAEFYLSGVITNREYEEAREQAEKKLARIIKREGDMDGERSRPYYLAQLIAEAVTAKRFSNYCNSLTREIKKEMPAAKAAGQI